MPQLCGAQNYWVAVDMPEDPTTLPLDANGMPDLPHVDDDFYRHAGQPRMVLMEGVLYHAFRCALSHQADLPDVELLPPTRNSAVAVKVDNKVRISADIIGRLLHAIVNAPENQGVFGTGKQAGTPDAGIEAGPGQADRPSGEASDAPSRAADVSSGADGASSGADGASSGADGASSGADGASSGADGASSGTADASSGTDGASSGADGSSSGADDACGESRGL